MISLNKKHSGIITYVTRIKARGIL